MGNGTSKLDSSSSSSSSSDPDAEESRISRFKNRVHLRRFLRRRRKVTNGRGFRSHTKLGSAEDFAGIAILTLIRVFLCLTSLSRLDSALSLSLSVFILFYVFCYCLFVGANGFQGQVASLCFIWRTDFSNGNL